MLRCTHCGAHAPATAYACRQCRGPLAIAKRPPPILNPAALQGRGVWRYHPTLPLASPQEAVTLGEGGTPLLPVPEIGAHAKCEFLNPTGSFKDRGSTVMVSKARALGATHVIEDSSGNAGTSVAAYAARAGLECTVYVPAWANETKIRAIRATGATVQKIEGPRQGVTDAAFDHCEKHDAYYASHTYTPWFVEGTKTLAYELYEDLNGHAPPSIVMPASMGTVLLGLRQGFLDLRDAGLIDHLPRLYAVNAASTAPLVHALHPDAPPEPDANRFADGILIPQPPRLPELVEAVTNTHGDAVAVTETETRQALEDLHHLGILVEPTSAVTLAGLRRFQATGHIADNENPTLILTGRFK